MFYQLKINLMTLVTSNNLNGFPVIAIRNTNMITNVIVKLYYKQ